MIGGNETVANQEQQVFCNDYEKNYALLACIERKASAYFLNILLPSPDIS
jgi:hypothetical protein